MLESSIEARFFLTPEEFDRGMETLRTVTYKPIKNIGLRLGNGILALMILYLPHIHKQDWTLWFHAQPLSATFLAGLILFNLWNALGQFGINKLNRMINRLDWERRVCFSDSGVDIDWGKRNFPYRWQDLLFFQETPDLLILKAGWTKSWTVPKRAIPTGSEERLRAMLAARIPQR